MAARGYEDAPELAVHQHNYPEPYHLQPPIQQGHYSHSTSSPKPEHQVASPQSGYVTTAGSATYAPSHLNHAASTYGGPPQGPGATDETKGGRKGGVICGCSLLVFVLSVVIAILAAAVIGLAAGTGVEANRANDANDRLQRLQASVSAGLFATTSTSGTATATATSSSASASSTVVIDNGCSTNPDNISGQSYTSFKLLGLVSFQMQCNKDVNGSVLMSHFAANFNTCMDSCAGWSKYTPGMFGNNINTTCAGVSFIPAWTSKTTAEAGGAPGNCYLKKGPLDTSRNFITVNIGTPVHGAIAGTS